MYKFEKFVLENGIRLIFVPTNHSETAVRLFIKGGSQHEREKESGISHFIEHMLFRGTEHWPTRGLIINKLDEIAPEDNNGAHTDLEETSYFLDVQPRHFGTAVDLLSDLVSAPLFRSTDIEIEKKLVSQEIRQNLDAPREYVQAELWQEVCFGDQPAGRPIYGTEETIRVFSERQIKDFFGKTYVGARMVLIVTGHIKRDAYLETIRKFFNRSGIIIGKPEEPFPIKNRQRSPKSLVLYKDTQQTHFTIGLKTPFAPGSMESYAAEILADILRYNIYLLFINDRGMAYSTRTHYFCDTTKGFIRSYAGVGHAKVEEAISDILNEYKRISQGRIEKQEVDRSVKFVIKRMKISSLKNPLGLADFLGTQELFAEHALSPEEALQIYRSLKIQQINETVKSIFTRANLNLAVIGPHPNQEKFQKIIEGF